jgi:MerR family copper efflux transcriptional regulator
LDGLTINQAAATTGWSARMLRYLESASLIEPARTASGYRLYRAGDLQRLRTLREMLDRFDCGLSEVAFANRMRSEPDLRDALERWFEEEPRRPEGVPDADWLRFEQEKHERLLAAAG